MGEMDVVVLALVSANIAINLPMRKVIHGRFNQNVALLMWKRDEGLVEKAARPQWCPWPGDWRGK